MRDDDPLEEKNLPRQTIPMRLRLRVRDKDHVVDTTLRRIDRNKVHHHEAEQGAQNWTVERNALYASNERIEITVDSHGVERRFLIRGSHRTELDYYWVCVDEPLQDVYRPSLFLDYLVPLDRAQDMHANLEDIYPLWVERHGAAKANWIKRWQVTLLIGGTWWEKLLSTAERLLKVTRLSG